MSIPTAPTKDDVVEAFLREGLDADPGRVRSWMERYPAFRADLLAIAARLAPATAAGHGPRVIGGDERSAIRANAIARSRELAAAAQPGLADLMRERGLDLPAVASRIDFPRERLSEVEAGHVEPPFPSWFVERLARALSSTSAVVASVLDAQAPTTVHAKAAGGATLGRISWRELIEESDMGAERKAYWLDGPGGAEG